MKTIWLLLGAVAVWAFGTEATHSAERRPNLIAIVTDDQGQWALGCYGNRDIKTPTLDQLAADGAVFNNAFTVTPVCSPSRAAYMSGRWPTQVGITDFLSPGESNDEQIGLHAPIWPAALHTAGYNTAMIGKWHLGTLPPFHPTKKGFDHFYGFLGGGTTPMNPVVEVRGTPAPVKGAEPDVHVDAAIAFLRQPRTGPFAICLHFRAPHLPYGPVPDEYPAMYQGVDPAVPQLPGLDIPKLKQSTLAYYASISNVDRALGRLFKVLDELKLADHTLVTFTSDHGYNEGRHYLDTKGNGQWMAGGVKGPKRPNMFDTSVRVPLVMRWPGVIERGRKIDDHVSNIDTYRTMLGAMGVKLPADAPVNGIDYSPLLKGEKLPPRDAIYGQYDLHNGGLAYLRMIRTSQYKYVKHFRAKGMDELYDLTSDPGELRNLIGPQKAEGRKIAAELGAKLLEWQRSIDDPVLRDEY
ncbi:MAG: sulfatase-like hydrolase/transferase [Planctomycetaceae bacterium]|nr:sulfatase-like hydrolase/transferase [Planctomycetaceae bacterium]